MAAGDFVAGVPNAVTVNAVGVKGVTDFSITYQGNNAELHTDDLQHPFDGGNINNAAPVIELTTMGARNEAGSPATVEATFPVGGVLAGSLVAVFAGRGALALAGTLTCTNVRVDGISVSNNGGRQQRVITMKPYGGTGSASGAAIAYA